MVERACNTLIAKVCLSRLLKSKINFSTSAYMEIEHLENRKFHFCQKFCKLGKLLIVITLLMHKILLIELPVPELVWFKLHHIYFMFPDFKAQSGNFQTI